MSMNSQNTACIIQARTYSSRLPGKILMKLDKNNTMLDYVINQLNYSNLANKSIIAYFS
jgi:spore coat polysaccharide biosynthesis protein SpsF (cytidylyltransferase family)